MSYTIIELGVSYSLHKFNTRGVFMDIFEIISLLLFLGYASWLCFYAFKQENRRTKLLQEILEEIKKEK